MDKDEYIQSLENLLIFMCQTYAEQEKVLFELAKEGNDSLFKVPRIQGSINTIPIAQLAKLQMEKPKYGFQKVKDEIANKRS